MYNCKILKLPIIALLFVSSLTAYAQDRVIPASDLPSEIKEYISKHFPENSITQAAIDKDNVTTTYEVQLNGNISLEFNNRSEIIEIDGNTKLPDGVIPEKIRQYVSANYPKSVITDFEIERKNQQIQLDNGLELEFNMKGDFLKIDN